MTIAKATAPLAAAAGYAATRSSTPVPGAMAAGRVVAVVALGLTPRGPVSQG
jgi:hypothetical protein